MTMHRILWSVLVAASLAVPSLATAATYYVATNGSGNCSNATNMNTPMAGIQAGINCLSGAGDTLYIRGGTYNENFTAPTASGSSYSNPIWIGAYQNETVTIRGTGGDHVLGMAGGSYIIFDKLNIVAISGMYYTVATGEGTQRIQNSNLSMEPFACLDSVTSPGGPVAFHNSQSDSSSMEFLNNDMHDSPCNYAFYVHGKNLTIDNNRIHDNAGYGIQVFMNPNGDGCCPDNTIIRNNFIYNNSWKSGDQCGITHFHGHNGRIHNNVIYGNKCGIGISGNSTDVWIYNNTIYNNNPGHPGYVGIIVERSINTRSFNNISYLNGTYDPDPGSNTNFQQGNNLVDIDPKFVNAGAHDFHLQQGSPAIDAGVDVGLPYSGPRPDIGAYEVGLDNGPGGTVGGGGGGGGSRRTLPAPQNLRMVTP